MRKLLSMLVVFCMLIAPVSASSSAAYALGFTDVPSDAWYADELSYAVSNGIVEGTSPTTFSPNSNVTRGQFVTMLGRMLGAELRGSKCRFIDVPSDAYYFKYVIWAEQAGYVSGVGNDRFAPDVSITYEQLGVLLANYIRKSGAELESREPSEEYADYSLVADWAKPSMLVMQQYWLIQPDADGYVHPQSAVNRANAVVALVRLAMAIGLFSEDLVEDPDVPLAVQPWGSLIYGNPTLIVSHGPYDYEAIDNNIRYMLIHGIREIKPDINTSPEEMFRNYSWVETDKRVGQAYVDSYLSVLITYPEFGYKSVGGTTALVSKTLHLNSFYGDDCSTYQATTFDKAVEIREILYERGIIRSSMSQTEKARVYFDWLIDNVRYVNYGDISHTAYGALINGEAVCQGYTAAFNLFLKLEGIECSTEMPADHSHIWTTCVLDGKSYHIDVTAADTSERPENYWLMSPERSRSRYTSVAD